MDSLNRSDLRQLIDVEDASCVSIFMPTHRAGAETLQDPIRLKNLIRDAERQMEERKAQPSAIRHLLEPLRELLGNYDFWQHQADGLAIFRSWDLFRYYRVPFRVPELAVVTASFHLKPLLPAVEANQRFYILALSQDSARIYEANRYSMAEVPIEMPVSPIVSTPAKGAERQVQSHTAERAGSGRRVAVFHGHGAGEEDRKQVLLAYFRRVDEVLRKVAGDDHVPVVLAAVEYLCPIYRQASSHPKILAGEIHGTPARLSAESLHSKAWDIASSHFDEGRMQAADEYHQLWHTIRTSKNLPSILTAARQGRVKALFVAVGVHEWGHIDPSTAQVVQEAQRSVDDQDLLNSAALETFVAGGVVYVVPPTEVPGRDSIAAVFRY